MWWSAAALSVYAVFHRYYFYGKIQANWLDKIPEENQKRLAQENKRRAH